jgi:hypothetical protein
MHERTLVQAESVIFLDTRQAQAAGVQEEELSAALGQAAAAPEASSSPSCRAGAACGWADACRNRGSVEPALLDYQACRPARCAKTGYASV